MRETAVERRLRVAIERELARADGLGNAALQEKRRQALAYYNGDKRGDELENRNQTISLDVAAAVNATLSLMRSMLIDEASVAFEAESDQDEAQARAEADICKDVLFKDNAGKVALMDAVKDGLLSGQAIMSVLPVPIGTGEDGVEDVEFRVTAVPSESVAYQSAYEGRFQGLRFWAEEIPLTRSELVELGVPKAKVDKLQAGASARGQDQLRNPGGVSETTGPESEGDVIYSILAYIKLDINGDGVAERHRVLCGPASDLTVLMHEPEPVIPYALGNPFRTPHRLTGESLFDRLKQTQDQNTILQRQFFDNIAVNNNGRSIYDPDRVNEDDILNPVAGGGIRARDVSAVVPFPVMDMTQGILGALDYNRRKRAELAGGALEMVSAEAQLAAKSATQASIEKGNSELISTLIADTLAQTLLRDLYGLVHYTLRTYATRPYRARVAGQTVLIDPLQWPAERRIMVKAGKSPGEKAQQAFALGQHLQAQIMALQAGLGGELADARTMYRTQMEILRLNGIESPDSFAIDPDSPGAMQARQQKAQQAAEQAQVAAMEKARVQQLEAAKLAEDARQHDQDIEFKYFDAQLDAATKEATLAAQGTIDLERERMSRESERDKRADREGAGSV